MTRRRSRLPSRSFRSRWRQAVVVVAVLVVVFLLRATGLLLPTPPPERLESSVYRVERVVDGDTLLLENGARVRLIGADTPETVKPDCPVEAWGPEATAFTKEFVRGGEVRLEFDGTRKDKFGRFLAYVWVGDRMLNEELIRAGLARAQTYFHYRSDMKTRFRRAEKEALAAGRGLHGG
jgi:micrococcal nuclease